MAIPDKPSATVTMTPEVQEGLYQQQTKFIEYQAEHIRLLKEALEKTRLCLCESIVEYMTPDSELQFEAALAALEAFEKGE